VILLDLVRLGALSAILFAAISILVDRRIKRLRPNLPDKWKKVKAFSASPLDNMSYVSALFGKTPDDPPLICLIWAARSVLTLALLILIYLVLSKMLGPANLGNQISQACRGVPGTSRN